MKLKALDQIPAMHCPHAAPVKRPAISGRAWIKGMATAIKSFQPKRELVAGGDVLWKPINKQAALMLSKSSDKHKTHEPISTMKTGNHTNKLDDSKHETARIVAKMTQTHERAEKDLDEFISRAELMKSRMEILTTTCRTDVMAFIEEIPKATEKLRTWRQTCERERDLSIKALSDLRKFFLSDDHEKEMHRLSEFVRISERLAMLAKDGTLEKIADVMLKLS